MWLAPSHGPPARVLSPLFFPAKSFLLPKMHGPSYSLQNCVILFLSPQDCVVPPSKAAAPRFKSQRPSSFAAPFLTPPTVSYTCQHFLSFQLYWAAIVSLGRCGPIARSQSPSSHAGAVTWRSCLPVTSWVEVTPISLAQSMATGV